MKSSLFLATALTVAFAATAQEKIAITPDLVAKAKQDGQVTLQYGAPLIAVQQMVKDFNKAYPDVHVNLERKPGTTGAQSLMQEAEAGVHRVDVLQGTEVESNADMIAHKLFAAVTPADFANFSPTALQMAPYLYYPSVVRSIVSYNPKLVTPAEAEKLKQWTGVLDPVFKGRFSVIEPSTGSSTATLLYIMNNPTLGADFLRKLKAQKPVIYLNGTLAREAVTSGQQAFTIFSQFDGVAMSDFGRGSPVRFVYINPTVEWPSSGWGVLDKAPHPNAARLLLAWVLSRDGASSFQGPLYNGRSTRTDVPDTRSILDKLKAAPWYHPPTEYWRPDLKDWVTNLEKYQKQWSDIMKGKE